MTDRMTRLWRRASIRSRAIVLLGLATLPMNIALSAYRLQQLLALQATLSAQVVSMPHSAQWLWLLLRKPLLVWGLMAIAGVGSIAADLREAARRKEQP